MRDTLTDRMTTKVLSSRPRIICGETKNPPTNNTDEVNEGIAFAELVSYIEDCRTDTLVAPCSFYRLKDLVNLYSIRLIQLGTNIAGRIHSTKLKDRILSYFRDMEAHKKGRDVTLAFKRDIGLASSIKHVIMMLMQMPFILPWLLT